MFRSTAFALTLIGAMITVSSVAAAQMTDADYMAKVATAAPAAVVKSATIVMPNKDGTMRTLQSGNNGFTCMVMPPAEPLCADKNAMAWAQAMMTHAAPPDGVGFVYMLAGDEGASNVDPMATAPTADNHWVKTGPHVMIVGPGVKAMGYPMTADANAALPYVMWANTPYAHLMIPVANPAP
jgi:hypothetical protein